MGGESITKVNIGIDVSYLRFGPNQFLQIFRITVSTLLGVTRTLRNNKPLI